MSAPLNPLVTVVIPTKNRARLLPRAIKSVLAQSYSNFELVIVDDGSSDNTPQTVQSFTDSRIHYIRHEVASGAAAARNAGVAASSGEYVAFLDDDDQLTPNKLSVQVEAFQKSVSTVGIVISDVDVFRDGTPADFFPYDGQAGSIFLHVLAGNFFPLNASLIARSQLPLFDTKLPCLEDIDMHLKVLQKSNAVYVATTCAVYNIDETHKRLSHDRVNMHRSFRMLLERWFNDPGDKLLADAKPELLSSFALRLFALGFTDEITKDYINRAFKLKKISRMLWLKILSFGGPEVLKRLR